MQETYGYGPEGQLITSSASTLTPTGPNPIPPASSASSTTSFSWNTASSIPEMIGVNGYYYIYVAGLPIEQIAPDGTILYYLHNRQGSTVALTDQQGNIIASYSYSPYGTLTCDTATSNQPASSCIGSSGIPPTPPTPPGATQSSTMCLSRAIEANHFLYDGQYLDTISGLYYLRARWYDPATAQFTSVDALVAITGQPYSYASGNPVNGADNTGAASTYSCVGVSDLVSMNISTTIAGCQPGGFNGVWVYTPLISYIQSHSGSAYSAYMAGNPIPFISDTFHILGILYADVYAPGAVGHNNYNRWAGVNSSCSAESFLDWFASTSFWASLGTYQSLNSLPGSSSFLNEANYLAEPVENSAGAIGSREGTLAYWFSRVGTTPFGMISSVVNLSTSAIEQAACGAFDAENMEIGDQVCNSILQASGF